MTTKKNQKRKPKKTVKKPMCLKIQWEKVAVNDKGDPVCSSCGEPAEMILGLFGNPCYAHK